MPEGAVPQPLVPMNGEQNLNEEWLLICFNNTKEPPTKNIRQNAWKEQKPVSFHMYLIKLVNSPWQKYKWVWKGLAKWIGQQQWPFNVVREMQPPVNALAPPCAGVWQWGHLSPAHPPVCPLQPLLGTKYQLPKLTSQVQNSCLVLASELVLNAKPLDFLLLSWYFANRLVSRGCLPALKVMDSTLWIRAAGFHEL